MFLSCGKINSIGVERFFEILHLQTHPQKDSTPTKSKLSMRISYTRDFLIQLASSPIAKRKPDFLPEHPVVLEKAVSSSFVSYLIMACLVVPLLNQSKFRSLSF
uniref:Uncharacterized protein n=1 Tax=Hucho hucho TaxID=62062 RepID=A0A4W5RZE8_9TELE